MNKTVPVARQISDFKVYVWYITGYEIYELDDYSIKVLLEYYCRQVHWMCVVRKYWFTSLRFGRSQLPQKPIVKTDLTITPIKVLKDEFEQIVMFS